jgi:hypothetical protein
VEWTANNCDKGKPAAVFIFGINFWVLWQDLWFFIKAIRVIKTENNNERQVVMQQPVSPTDSVHSPVRLSGVYGSSVSVVQICLSPSVICCQYQSTNASQPFTYLSPEPNNLTN